MRPLARRLENEPADIRAAVAAIDVLLEAIVAIEPTRLDATDRRFRSSGICDGQNRHACSQLDRQAPFTYQ